MDFSWLPFRKKNYAAASAPPQVFLTNTLSGRKELFVSLKPRLALTYSCGPTVYSRQHIGNLNAAVFSDTLARTLLGAGFHVKRVTNITDVGHLTDDGDRGEDKMALGAKQEKASPADIATRYARIYMDDLSELNVHVSEILFPRATEYIREQIALIKTLEEKGFTYKLKEGLYFDTSRFPAYGRLGNIGNASILEGARVAPVVGKRNPMDFALWRTVKPGDLQIWESPWGAGNPGWHIECSAMSRALLGTEIDIHTGGEEHVNVHHNNEIAQSEGASGRTFVRYWLHNAHLTLGGEKISKSLGNTVYLSDITAKGIPALALRYFFLQAHYRTPLSFSWDALSGAAGALERLWRLTGEVRKESGGVSQQSEARIRFLAAMRDDLATPQALGILWEALRSDEYAPEEKWGLLEDAEAHLGLSLLSPPLGPPLALADIPALIREKLSRRETARREKNYAVSDTLRKEIEESGYLVEDRPDGAVLTKRAR